MLNDMGKENKTVKYHYHYCAQWQESPGTYTHADGIAILGRPVQTQDDYQRLKQTIHADNAHRMTILSLTPLPPASVA